MPVIQDRGGYEATRREFQVAGVDIPAIEAMQAERRLELVTDLLQFDVASRFTRQQAEALHEATGMRIGDRANLYKDTLGKGRFAGNVYMYLERGRQDGTWHISAFSHNVNSASLPDVAAMWQRLDRLLPDIATDVEDKSAVEVRQLAVDRNTNNIQAAALATRMSRRPSQHRSEPSAGSGL